MLLTAISASIIIDTIDYITRIGLIGVIVDDPCFTLAAFAS